MKEQRRWFKNGKPFLVLCVILAAVVRIFFLFRYEHTGAGAAGNVERAFLILANPSLRVNFDGNSSTLYKYMIASFMYFWHDPILAPRTLTTLFGIFLVVPYYGTLKVLFDRTVAFLSSLVLAFYPLHIIQSSVTTSDAVYYFFLFGSFYYFFNYKSEQGRLSDLWLSALSFNIASLLRFECWIFIPVFFLLLWPKGKKVAFLFLPSFAFSPCVSLLLNKIIDQDFLYTFTASAQTTHREIMIGRIPYDPRPWSWLAILWRSTGPGVVIGGLSGIVLAFLTRQKRQLSAFFLILFSGFTINTLAARMTGTDRYSIVLALLLIPYAWFFGERALAFLGIRKKIFLVLLLIFPAASFWQIAHKPFKTMRGILCIIPPEVKTLGLWLKNNVRPDETLLVSADYCDVWQDDIMLYSGISPKRYMIVGTLLSGRGGFEDKEKLSRYFLDHRTKYLVLNTEGYLQKILNLQPGKRKQTRWNISFEAVFEKDLITFGKYIVYRISY